nr:THUMP domain-containing protein [Klebsiella pneumoniae subsp. pneumoniae]
MRCYNFAYSPVGRQRTIVAMKFIIKLFPEITIKSQSVRLRFIKILTGNIRNVLKNYDETLAVVRHWDHIEVRAKDENQRPAIRDALTRIPGIHHILEVEDVPFTSLHDIFEQTLPLWREALEGKTFCVRVKRRGKHEFTSIEVERYVGGGLNQHIETARVKLTDPDVTVNLEIENDRLLLVKAAMKASAVSRSAPGRCAVADLRRL